MSKLKNFLNTNSGAVSVEFVIIAAAVVSIGFGATAAVNAGLLSLVPEQNQSTSSGSTDTGVADSECTPSYYDMSYFTGGRQPAGRALAQANRDMTDQQLRDAYLRTYSQLENFAYNTNNNNDLTNWYDTAYLMWQELEARGMSLSMTDQDFLQLVARTEPERLQGGTEGCEDAELTSGMYESPVVAEPDQGRGQGQGQGQGRGQGRGQPQSRMASQPAVVALDQDQMADGLSENPPMEEFVMPQPRQITAEPAPQESYQGRAFNTDEIARITDEYTGLNRRNTTLVYEDLVEAFTIGQDRRDRAVMAATVDRLYVLLLVSTENGYQVDEMEKTFNDAVTYFDFLYR